MLQWSFITKYIRVKVQEVFECHFFSVTSVSFSSILPSGKHLPRPVALFVTSSLSRLDKSSAILYFKIIQRVQGVIRQYCVCEATTRFKLPMQPDEPHRARDTQCAASNCFMAHNYTSSLAPIAMQATAVRRPPLVHNHLLYLPVTTLTTTAFIERYTACVHGVRFRASKERLFNVTATWRWAVELNIPRAIHQLSWVSTDARLFLPPPTNC